MVKTEELMTMAESLPIDLKTQLINKLLNSLNPSQKEIDEAWAVEAEKRLEDVKTGKIKLIDGEEVFKEIKERLMK